MVKQVDGYKNTLKVFLWQDEGFLENSMDQLSRETKNQIVRRFPILAAKTKALLAGRHWAKGSVEEDDVNNFLPILDSVTRFPSVHQHHIFFDYLFPLHIASFSTLRPSSAATLLPSLFSQ